MSNQIEKTRTIAGKRVRVEYKDCRFHPCGDCCFEKNGKCLADRECFAFDNHPGKPYFVPADVQEAEIRKINITPNEVRYIIDAIPGADGIFRAEADAKRGLAIFKAGMLAERERMASCHTIEGWVARDKCGELYFFKERPTRGATMWNTEDFCAFMPFPQRNLPSLRWDDEPREVEIIVKSK